MTRIPAFAPRSANRVRLSVAIAMAATLSAWGALAAEDSPKAGGTLVIALGSQVPCIDPQQDDYGYAAREGRELVDSLTDQSYADPNKIVPWLAESWEISKDATSYVFHLRKDVTFSDGTALDADVVKANFDTLSKIPGAAGASYFEGAKAITAVDKYTLRIDFNQPNVPFLAATSTAELGIVAPATLQKTPDERCHTGVIGSGPFVLDNFKINEKAELIKRPGYNWPSSLRSHTGEAYLDRIVYRIVPEATVRTGALRGNQVNIIEDTAYDDANNLIQDGFPLIKADPLGMTVTLLINTSRGILADKLVRLAFTHGINRQEIIDLAFSGFKAPASGLLTNKTPGYLDQSAELKYDPDTSRKLLDQAGWQPGADGIRVKDGQPLVITVSFYSAPINKAFLEVIQQELRDVGIDFRLRPLVGGAYGEALLKGDYEIHRWGWTLGDPDVLRQIYSSKTLNRLRLPPDNKIDGLLDAQRATIDPVQRKKLVDEVQQIILAEGYAIPVFVDQHLWSTDGKAQGIEWGAPGAGDPSQILYDTYLPEVSN